MLFIVGTIIVLGCVMGGYMANGGHMSVLWQPFEYVIIMGAAIGGFVISNPKKVLSGAGGAFKDLLSGCTFTKEHYVELLCLLYTFFKLLKTKGVLAIEKHIENPHESALFNQFPKFAANHHAVEFICDYFRLMTLGTDDPNEMEDLINEELETHHHEREQMVGAFQFVADSMPALGIVAAVLGVIHTMGSITEPPEVLGHLIGGALVGTFFGVLIAYGFVGPIANSLKNTYDAEARFYQCIKTGILAHLNGYAPAISIEFARKVLTSDVRPTFLEVEATVSELPAPA